MTWSYTPGGTDALDKVRFLVGDTLTSDQQLQDEEINALVATTSTIYGAAAACCNALASKFSRSVTFKAGQSSANFSDLAKAYRLQALGFDQQAALFGSGLPYAGGLSKADKAQQEANTDRVLPQFNYDMDDNDLLPFGGATNETQGGDDN